MPLYPAVDGQGVVQPNPEPPPPIARPAETVTVTLSRGGESLDLPTQQPSDAGWLLLEGVEGLDIPASTLIRQRAAGQFGSYAVGVDVVDRPLFFPLLVDAGLLGGMLAAKDILNQLTSPFGGEPVRVTVTRPDGTTRWIDAFRDDTQGMPWAGGQFNALHGWHRFGLALSAPDPWWRGEPITPLTWQLPPLTPGSAFPLPWRVRADRIFNEPRAIVVPGSVSGFPRWTVAGPGSAVTVRHVESGRRWSAVGNLTVSTSLVVDTDPRIAATTGLQATNIAGNVDRWDWIQPPFDLWELPPGPQTVILDVTGATPDTTAQMDLVPLYETA